MLNTIFKALLGLGLGYLRNCLSSVVSVHLIQSNRTSMLLVPSVKECQLVGPGRYAFFAISLLMKHSPSGDEDASILLAFPKALKTWFWGLECAGTYFLIALVLPVFKCVIMVFILF